MQLKDFVSKKAIIASMVIIALGIGVVAGITYRSAQNDEQGATIMPQKTTTSNYTSPITKIADAATPSVTTPTNADTSTTKKKSKTVIDANCPVKAETNSKGKNVFYLPNMRGYAKVSTTTCFKSAELAAAAGYASASTK